MFLCGRSIPSELAFKNWTMRHGCSCLKGKNGSWHLSAHYDRVLLVVQLVELRNTKWQTKFVKFGAATLGKR